MSSSIETMVTKLFDLCDDYCALEQLHDRAWIDESQYLSISHRILKTTMGYVALTKNSNRDTVSEGHSNELE